MQHPKTSSARSARDLPALNKTKTHCNRGHALSGENLRIDALGARVCLACRQARHPSFQSQQIERDKKRVKRASGDIVAGYTASVVATTPTDTVRRVLDLVRKTGRQDSALQEISRSKLVALKHFSPTFGEHLKAARTAGRLALFQKGLSWKTNRPIRPDLLLRHQSASLCTKPLFIRSPQRELTGVIAAPANDIFAAVDAGVPRRLPYHIRGDVMGMMCEAIWAHEMSISDIPKMLRKFVSKAYGVESRFQSLDTPMFDDGRTTRLDRIPSDFWEQRS